MTITVNSNSDAGTCSGSTITLRCAIATANANTVNPTLINFGFSGTIKPGSDLLINNFSQPITIDGSGQTIIIDGHGAIQIFNVGTSASFNALTLLNGNAGSGWGGGLVNNGTLTISNSLLSGNAAAKGGAVLNYGTLTVSSSALSTNSASEGGGVENYGTVTLNNSTLSSDSAQVEGGGVFNQGTLTVINSTFFGNSAPYGGGIFSVGPLTLTNSTLSGNTAIQAGGGLATSMYVANLKSTIVAKNTGPHPDIDGFTPVNSLGHNLIGDGTGSSLTNGTNGDQVGSSVSPINPILGNLTSNGGLTQTQALLAGSPAIGQGDCSGNSTVNPPIPVVTTDQRGFPRKLSCDVGAFETAVPITDTIGIYRAGTFYLRLHNSTGNADLTVVYSAGTKPYPVVGDWIGSGFDSIGVYDQSNGQFWLRNTNTPGVPDEQFVLGNPNDVPIAGRWSGSNVHAGVGVFRPSNGLIYLKNLLTTGYADHTMVLGIPGDVGLAGDWNGKSFDSPGTYRPSNSTFYLSNQVINGSVYGDYQMLYGIGGDTPIVGDWIAQGHDGVGLFRQSNGFTYLKNQLVTGYADNAFTFGIPNDVPIAGHWQAVYPPIAPAPVLISKTAVPSQLNDSVSGDNPIGD